MKILANKIFASPADLAASIKPGQIIKCACCLSSKFIVDKIIFNKKNGSVLYFKGYNIDYLKKEEATIDIRFYNLLLYLPEPKYRINEKK